MSVAEVLPLLRCPRCRLPLAEADGGVRCGSGHRFDLARQGYLNLLGSAQPAHADTAAMVAARSRFLATGAYGAVAAGLVDAARAGLLAARGHLPGAPALLEAGAGTGYYTAALLDALGGRGIALDISVPAARRAARAHPRLAAVVADAWSSLPVADRVVDVVASVFAPRNPAEFARVLRDDGVLVVVIPQPQHLQEVRSALSLLAVEPAKQERLAATLSDRFTRTADVTVSYPVAWLAADVVDLVRMGPNAFHLDESEILARTASLPDPVTTTVAVAISTWTPRPEPIHAP